MLITSNISLRNIYNVIVTERDKSCDYIDFEIILISSISKPHKDNTILNWHVANIPLKSSKQKKRKEKKREEKKGKESRKKLPNPLLLWVVWNNFLVGVGRAEKNQQEKNISIRVFTHLM